MSSNGTAPTASSVGTPANTSPAQPLYARQSCACRAGSSDAKQAWSANVGKITSALTPSRIWSRTRDSTSYPPTTAVSSWSAVISLRGSRPSACSDRQPSLVSMRGTRSRYSASTRSAYSSIGSVTCESVEM